MRKTILNVDIDTFQDDEGKDIVAAIQQGAQEKTEEEKVTRNSFPLRPSSALKSQRDLYYGLENWEKPGTIPTTPIEGRACMLLSLGHAIEKNLVWHIKNKYEVVYTNVRVKYGEVKRADGAIVELDGELDFVLKLPSGELVICDSKSSGAYAFRGELPKDEHVAQINLYLHSQWAKDNGIKRAFVFYYNKDTSDLKICSFYYDKDLAEATIDRFQHVLTRWEHKQKPRLEYILGVDWQAKYSSFRDYEWAEYEKDECDRAHTTLTEMEEKALPTGDKKELLRFFVKEYGTKVVFTPSGKKMYARKKNADMTLNVKDEDGFE